MMAYSFSSSGLPKYGKNTDLFTSLTNAIMDGLCCQNMSAVWSEDQPGTTRGSLPDACFGDSTEDYEVRSDDIDDADSCFAEESHGPSLQSSAPGCVIPTCPTREEVQELPTCGEFVRGRPSPVPREVTRQRRPLVAMNDSEDYEEFDYDCSIEQHSQASSSWIGGSGTVVTGTTYTAQSTPLSPTSTFTGATISTAQPARIEEQYTKSPLVPKHEHQRQKRRPSTGSSSLRRHGSPLQDCYYYYKDHHPSSPSQPHRPDQYNPSFSPRQPPHQEDHREDDRETSASLDLPMTPTTVNTTMAVTPTKPFVGSVMASSPPPSAVGIVYPSSPPVPTFKTQKGSRKKSSSNNSPSATVTTADTSATTIFEFSIERPSQTNPSTDNDSLGTSKMSEGERRRRKLMEEKLRLSRSSSFATCSTQSSLLDEEEDEEGQGMEYLYHDDEQGDLQLVLDTGKLELKLDDTPPDENSAERRGDKRHHLPRLQVRRPRPETVGMYN